MCVSFTQLQPKIPCSTKSCSSQRQPTAVRVGFNVEHADGGQLMIRIAMTPDIHSSKTKQLAQNEGELIPSHIDYCIDHPR